METFEAVVCALDGTFKTSFRVYDSFSDCNTLYTESRRFQTSRKTTLSEAILDRYSEYSAVNFHAPPSALLVQFSSSARLGHSSLSLSSSSLLLPFNQLGSLRNHALPQKSTRWTFSNPVGTHTNAQSFHSNPVHKGCGVFT